MSNKNNISTNKNSIVTPKIIKNSNKSTKRIVTNVAPLSKKMYHTTQSSNFYPDFYDDLGLDNLYNDTPDADLRDY